MDKDFTSMGLMIEGNVTASETAPQKRAGVEASIGVEQDGVLPHPTDGVSRGVAWLTVLSMLGLCYLMVSVPLLIYSDRTGVAKKEVRMAFAPVGWLHDRTPLRYPLRLYAAMWGVRPD